MTRLHSLVSWSAVALSVSLVGCGSSGSSTGSTSDASTASGPDTSTASGADTSGAVATALTVIPKSGEVANWTIDPANDKTAGLAAATGTSEKAVEGLIDGAAADFYNGFTPVLFAWQNYVNTTLPVADAPNGATAKVYVLQMSDATQASGVYASLLSASLYSKYTWTDPSSPIIGLRSRIVDTNQTWWINFYKGNFYVEVDVTPSAGPKPDYTPGLASTKAAAIAFAQAIAAKI